MDITEDIIIDETIDFSQNPFSDSKNDIGGVEENKFNPSQARDAYGRWAGTAGYGSPITFTKASSAKLSDQRARVTKEAEAMVKAMTPDDAYLGEKIKGIAKDLNIQAVKGPIKKAKRMVPKAIEELGGNVYDMKDVVRGTVVMQNYADKQKIIDRISKDFEIARIKDLDANGYKDTKVNIVLPHSKLVGELILITPELLNAKMKPTLYKESGHDLYDVIRDSGQSAKAISDAGTKSEKIYVAAVAKYDSRVATGGKLELDYLADR